MPDPLHRCARLPGVVSMQRLRHHGGDGNRGVRHADPSTTERRAALRASLPAPPRILVAAPHAAHRLHTRASLPCPTVIFACERVRAVRGHRCQPSFENSARAPRPAARSSVAAEPLCPCLPSCASALRLHPSRFYSGAAQMAVVRIFPDNFHLELADHHHQRGPTLPGVARCMAATRARTQCPSHSATP
jgi:hypothetical protein